MTDGMRIRPHLAAVLVVALSALSFSDIASPQTAGREPSTADKALLRQAATSYVEAVALLSGDISGVKISKAWKPTGYQVTGNNRVAAVMIMNGARFGFLYFQRADGVWRFIDGGGTSGCAKRVQRWVTVDLGFKC